MSYQKLAEAYYKLLNGIDWDDIILVKGIREGLNKFLSNAFASQFPKGHKHHKTHLVSAAALKQLESKNYRNLVYEHLVPKSEYIQKPCEERAKNKTLTVEFVIELLEKYWKVATITKEEDFLLARTKMPDDWDKINILSRYESAGLKLVNNPKYRDPYEPRIVGPLEPIRGDRL